MPAWKGKKSYVYPKQNREEICKNLLLKTGYIYIYIYKGNTEVLNHGFTKQNEKWEPYIIRKKIKK